MKDFKFVLKRKNILIISVFLGGLEGTVLTPASFSQTEGDSNKEALEQENIDMPTDIYTLVFRNLPQQVNGSVTAQVNQE
ncbi:MAG: hypothetical protein AAFO04_00975 [Cyanobacteria bacterium J06592_8]